LKKLRTKLQCPGFRGFAVYNAVQERSRDKLVEPRRLKLNVRLRLAAADARPAATACDWSATVADCAAGGRSTLGDVMSMVELALLSRILILLRRPDRLLELLLLTIADTCLERSLSIDKLLLSGSYHHHHQLT